MTYVLVALVSGALVAMLARHSKLAGPLALALGIAICATSVGPDLVHMVQQAAKSFGG